MATATSAQKSLSKLKVRQFMHRGIFTISANDSLHDAILLMNEKNIGCLIVKIDEERFGILSERDVIKEYAVEFFDFNDMQVGELMTVSPITIKETDPLLEAFALMDRFHIRHLPVLDQDGEIVGILSARDLVHAVIKNSDYK